MLQRACSSALRCYKTVRNALPLGVGNESTSGFGGLEYHIFLLEFSVSRPYTLESFGRLQTNLVAHTPTTTMSLNK